jgi:hypothetical protein
LSSRFGCWSFHNLVFDEHILKEIDKQLFKLQNIYIAAGKEKYSAVISNCDVIQFQDSFKLNYDNVNNCEEKFQI